MIGPLAYEVHRVARRLTWIAAGKKERLAPLNVAGNDGTFHLLFINREIRAA